jgi:hypothetical protein
MNSQHDDTDAAARRLGALLDAYGADPSRWPTADQAGAQARLANAPAEAQVEARRLDRALAALPAPPAPDAALRRRILAAVPLPRLGPFAWLQAIWAELGGARRAGPAFALSLLLGVLLAPLASSDADAAGPEIDLVALDDDYEELLP